MKKILTIISLAILGLMAVSCYDDSALWNSMKDYENRLASLEAKHDALNGEVSSLKTLVAAMQQGDYVTSIVPVKEAGKEVGYTITFAKNGTITIKNGTDAESGTTPKIGVKKDTDGIYYWTVDGNWLLDEAGKKVKASGTDGKDGAAGTPGAEGSQGTPGTPGADGITPKLKIENEYWYVSYDDGKTWTPLNCKATGEDGAPGKADSIFKAVYQKDGYLVVEMADGNVFNIPMGAVESLGIQLSIDSGVAIVPGSTLKVKYVVTGGDENTLVRAIINEEFVYGIVKPETPSEGYIYLYLEDWFDGPEDEDRDEILDDEFGSDITEENYYHSMITVLITVTDGKGNQVIKAFNVAEGQISSVIDAFIADAEAGNVTAQVQTNVDYSVVVNEKDAWLSFAPATKAQMRTDELVFAVAANTENKFRSSVVNLVNNMNQTLESFVILQRSPVAGEAMKFVDKDVEAACVAAFDTNLDGVLSYEEAALVTDLGKLRMPASARSFTELEHFVGIKRIPDMFFANCMNLRSVNLPEQITAIGEGAFYNCFPLNSITIPQSVVSIGYRNDDDYGDYYGDSYGVFEGCHGLQSVEIPLGVKELNTNRLFKQCLSLASVTLPDIDRFGYEMFMSCFSLNSFDIPETVKYFDSSVFANSGLVRFTLPESMEEVPAGVCLGCPELSEVILHDGVKRIHSNAFEGCMSLTDIVLPSTLEYIGSYAFTNSGIKGKEVQINDKTVCALQIPETVKVIEWEAFAYCDSLKAIQFLSSAPCEAYSRIVSRHTMVYVPNGCYDAYKSTWNDVYNWAEKMVGIVGDFNGWNFWNNTMIKNVDGWYTAEIVLNDATNFCFIADDNWELSFRLSPDHQPDNLLPDVIYDLVSSDYNGSDMSLFERGKYVFYLSEDMSKFYFTREGSDVEKLTVADFITREEGSVYYELTGVITSLKNSLYGNFDLTDETGTVYVYGLTASQVEKNDQSFALLGLKAGDIVTIRGTRTSYKDQVQVGGPAYYVSHVPGEEIITSVETVTIAQFLEKEISSQNLYRVSGTITSITNTTYGNLYIKDEEGTELYVYGLKEHATAGNQTFASLGLNEGDIVTIVGYRSEFNGVPQMKDAYYESHVSSGSGQQGSVLAEWLFTSVAMTDYEATFGGTVAVNDKAAGDGGMFIPANVSGDGKIIYVQVDKSEIDINNKAARLVGSTGHPYVVGTWPGDYWQFEFSQGQIINKGSRVSISYITRTSKTGMKYWRLEYLDGDSWKPAMAVTDVTVTDGSTISYNIEMAADGKTNVEVNSEVEYESDTVDPKFRMICLANEQASGNGPIAAPNGGTCRIAGAEGSSPIIKLVYSPDGLQQ